MNKAVCIYILILSIMLPPVAFGGDSPKRELRGVWLATVWGIDWPSTTGTTPAIISKQKSELMAILDRCVGMNLTTVYFQVRSMGDVMYESKLEPWSSFVSGKRGVSPGWDPLQFVVDECHRRGLECYAWVNPFRWSSGPDYNTAADREWKRRGWLLSYGKYTVFNPGLEEVRAHVVDICREIVEGYEVDGLVFDDYFYPNRIPEDDTAADAKLHEAEAPWMTLGDWRRANVHKTVADVGAMIRDTRPEVRFGISPAGVAGKIETSAGKWGTEGCNVRAADWQFNEIYSDPVGIMYQGTVDFMSPQLYWPTTHPTAPFGSLAEWWSNSANLYGRHFYSSVTLENIGKGDKTENIRDLSRQVEKNREVTVDGNLGFVIYSAKFLPQVETTLAEGAFARHSLSPRIASGTDAPSSPDGLKLSKDRLTWKPVVLEGRGVVRYSVYEIPRNIDIHEVMSEDGDGISAEYLVGVTYEPSIVLAVNAKSRYAVCTLDGYSAESEPAWID